METPPRKQPKIVSVSLSTPSKSKSSKKSSKSSSPKKHSLKASSPHVQNSPPNKLSANKPTNNSALSKQSANKFNMNLKQLKKTFKDSKNVFEKIGEESQRRKAEVERKRRQQQLIKKQKLEELEQKQPEKLTKNQFYACKELFKVLDKGNKNYTTVEDLEEIKAWTNLQETLKIVYFRKNISTFYDFVYALWQSGQILQIMKILESETD